MGFNHLHHLHCHCLSTFHLTTKLECDDCRNLSWLIFVIRITVVETVVGNEKVMLLLPIIRVIDNDDCGDNDDHDGDGNDDEYKEEGEL